MFSFFSKSIKASRMQLSTRSTKVFEFLSSPVRISTDESKLPEPTKIDRETIELLEKVSLVKFESEKGVEIVENAIRFADQIFEVDTTNIKPLVTVLEDECLRLREDLVESNVTRYELMTHCKVSEENYYIAPAENIKYIDTKKSEINTAASTQSSPIKLENICKN